MGSTTRNILNRWVAAGLLATIAWLALSRPAAAAGSVSVAPAFLRLQISATAPLRTESVMVRNDYAVPISFTADLADVDQNSGSLVPVTGAPFSLSETLAVAPQQFSLEPGQSINLQISAQNTDRLSPGGHYAAVLVRQASADSGQVPIEPAVSVALFITKEDGAVRQVSAAVDSLHRVTTQFPAGTTVTFSTTGNVDVVPVAEVSLIKSVSTNVFAKSVVNDRSIPLFPGKELRLQTTFTRLQTPRWPGKYGMLVRSRYQGQAAANESVYWFWYVPIWFIVVSAALIVCGPLLLIWLVRHLPVALAKRLVRRRRERRRSRHSRQAVQVQREAEVTSTPAKKPRPAMDIYRPPATTKPKQNSQPLSPENGDD